MPSSSVNEIDTPAENQKYFASTAVQCTEIKEEKATQASVNIYMDICLLWDNDNKLFTMTGVPSMAVLNVMVKMCIIIRPTENLLWILSQEFCLLCIN